MKSELLIKITEGTSNQQLILFPYLGGSRSSFQTLISELSDTYQVWVANPPGHIGSTIPFVEDMNQMVDMYYEALKEIVGEEYYLVGHSMGGNIAYFLAKKLCSSESKLTKPKGIIITGSGSPKVMHGQNISQWDEDRLLDKVKSYGLLPKELINEDEILQAFVPIFRADYKILETGANIEIEEKLELAAYLLWGEKDTVEPVDLVADWLRYFKNKLVVIPIKDGTHMFINSHAKEVSQYIDKIVEGCYNVEED